MIIQAFCKEKTGKIWLLNQKRAQISKNKQTWLLSQKKKKTKRFIFQDTLSRNFEFTFGKNKKFRIWNKT